LASLVVNNSRRRHAPSRPATTINSNSIGGFTLLLKLNHPVDSADMRRWALGLPAPRLMGCRNWRSSSARHLRRTPFRPVARWLAHGATKICKREVGPPPRAESFLPRKISIAFLGCVGSGQPLDHSRLYQWGSQKASFDFSSLVKMPATGNANAPHHHSAPALQALPARQTDSFGPQRRRALFS
jgi:hypothetical protein